MNNKIEKLEKSLSFSDESAKNLNEYNNWSFGISLALMYFLVTQFSNFEIDGSSVYYVVYKILLFLSMVSIFFTGLIKQRLMVYNANKNAEIGGLKKIIIIARGDEEKINKEEWDKKFKNWEVNHNKLIKQSKNVENLFWINSCLTILVGVFILIIL